MSLFNFIKFEFWIFLRLLTVVIFCNHLSQYSVTCGKRASVNKISRSKELKHNEGKENFLLKRKLHKLKFLTQKAIKRLSTSSDYSYFNTNYLQHILRVRVPGTVGHHAVKQFIIKKLDGLGWHVDLDEFKDATPFGDKTFTNIIATLNPNANRRLAIAAHYDSKLLTPENGKYFVAASDSAVPCAMLLDFAKLLAEKSKELRKNMEEVTPMLLFLDGEEAFVEWTKNDSIYGARHLAERFATQPHHRKSLAGKSISFADSINAFVLLDLLGTPDPTIYDLNPPTSHLYQRLQVIERNLKENGQINNRSPYFAGSLNQPIYIEDDHVPFLRKGIPILHIIPIPFPKEWHTLADDESALHPPTVENLLKIFRQFFLEYFHLS